MTTRLAPAPGHPTAPAVPPWVDEPLPPGTADLLRPHLGTVTAEMIAAIREQIPEYNRPRDDAYARGVAIGVEQGLHCFVDQLEKPGAPGPDWYEVFQGIGAGEMREGRSLDALQSALRLAARVAWQRLLVLVGPERVPPLVVGRLAEATLAYLDEIARACADGYARAQAAAVGEVERRRRRLVELLLTDPPVSADEIAALARAARWEVPRRLLAVAVAAPARPGPVFPPEVLASLDRPVPCLIVPDSESPARLRALIGALGSRYRLAVGPAVDPSAAAHSLRWAAQALGLAARGVLPATGTEPVWCHEHLATLAIFQDERLLGALAERSLAPLDGIRASQRDVLADTLLAWLTLDRNATEVAARLHVHPQTVRYRMRQLDRLFSDALHDPEQRLALEIALRADQARRATPPDPAAG